LDVPRAAARRLPPVAALILACLLSLALPGGKVLAQYVPIPNYVGIGAGLQFRTDINNHLSGVTPIAPRLVSLDFAKLPAEQDGQLYWCPDCQQTNPCLGGGTGALALGFHGQFSCTFGSSGGTAFPLTADVSAANHHITSLAPDTLTGEALSRNQSNLNSLASPSANYGMANTTLTGMASAAASGQPLIFGQSSGRLNGLNLLASQLSNLGPANVSGEAIAFGQSGAQLTAHAPPSFRSFSSCNALGSQTAVTCNAPSGFVGGDLELAGVWFNGNVGGTIGAPSGWTLVGKVNSSPFIQLWIFQHTAIAGDTTFHFTVTGDTGSLFAMVIDLIGAASVDQSSFGSNNTFGNSPLTVSSIAINDPAEYVLEFAGNAPSFLTITKGTLLAHADTGGGNSTTNVWGFDTDAISTPPVTMTYTSGLGRMAGAQVGIVGSAILTSGVVTLDAPYNEQNNLVGGGVPGEPAPRISGFNFNGDFNPVAYGADPTGTQCSDIAIQAAINAACAASSGGGSSTPRVLIPAGQYLVCNTLVDTCATQGVQLIGVGMFSSILQNRIGNGINIGGSTLLTSNSATVSSFGGASILYQSALVGTGSSLNWNDGGSPSDLLLDLNEAAGPRPLNGLSQFDARLFLNTPNVTQLQVAVADDGAADVKNCSTQTDGLAGCNGAFGIFVGTDSKLHFRINVGGTWRTFTGTAVSANTTYEAELSYDGTNIRCFQDSSGTMAEVCKQAATGTISERIDESLTVGAISQFWDDLSPGFWWNGRLDSVQLSKVARCTSDAGCAVSSSKFAGDGNTLMLLNFDGTNAAANLPLIQPDYVNGNQIIGGTLNSWLTMRNYGLGNPEQGFVVRDLGFAGGNYGIVNVAAMLSLEYVDIANPAYGVLMPENNTFNSDLRNVIASASVLPLALEGGLTNASNLQLGCGAACMITGGPAVRNAYVLTPGGASWSIIGMGNLMLDQIADDTENGGAFPAVTMNNIGGGAHLEVLSSALNPSGGPVIRFEGPFSGLTAIDTQLNPSPAASGTIIDGSSVPVDGLSGGIDLVNDVFGGGLQSGNTLISGGWPVNLINTPGTSGIPNDTLAQVPTFDAGLSHLTVNFVANPSTPTIGVTGPTGTTSYGPYYVVCHDGNGGITNVSAASNTIADGPATLSPTNNIQVQWSVNPACYSYDVLKGNTTTALLTGVGFTTVISGQTPGNAAVADTGQATSAYSPPTRNTTSDVNALDFISSGTTFAQLPLIVPNGAQMYCSDCAQTAICTGGGTGAMAQGIDGAWSCSSGSGGGGGGGGGGPNQTQTTITGSTAGTAVCSTPWQTTAYKEALCFLNGYENATGIAQTYSYGAVFTHNPVFTANSVPPGATSTTTLSLPIDMTVTETGWIMVGGY
jgi:hypothetical protein